MATSSSWSPSLNLAFVSTLLIFVLNPKFIVVAQNYEGGGIVGDGNNINQRRQLCNADLSTILPPPYNNISNWICTPVWNTFLIRYHRGEDNKITFIVSAIYTTGWVGVGFSKDGRMVGSSAMVGWINKKGHAKIKQYYLQGNTPSQVVPDAGEIDLTKVPPSVSLGEAMIYLAFQARFQTPLAHQPIILAFGTRTPNHHHLSVHDDKTTILFDFAQGGATSLDTKGEQMRKSHGILGYLAWGLFLPVGAILARYLRHKDPLWYYLHAAFQFVGFLLGLAAVILGRQFYVRFNATVAAHRGIGIFAFVLSILQVLAFFLRPKKDAKIRRYWNWYHHWFGRLALFFGAVNIVLGINVASAGKLVKIAIGFQFAVILISVIILEALYWMRGRSEKTIPPPPPRDFQMNPM